MKKLIILALISLIFIAYADEMRTIHVYVALCDNEHQNIVPVPGFLGNGKDPDNNLYWGAGGGTKTFMHRSEDWKLLTTINNPEKDILERVIFKHKEKEVYLLADAYDGKRIKTCMQDFFLASSHTGIDTLTFEDRSITFGGSSDLVVYIGHDGLMDFDLGIDLNANTDRISKDAIMLSCISKRYFADSLKSAGAYPLLWTTGLMPPEAYTLEAALEGWINNESGEQIKERAAQAYNRYQHCGINAARNLFTSGW